MFRRTLVPFAALAVLAHVLPTPARAQEVVDGIAAVVNGEVITFSQIRELVGARERALRETYRGQELVDQVRQARESALKDLIDRQLILQEFKRQGFSIPDYVVDERVQTIIREEFGGDRAAFLRTLQAQGFTLEKFREIERDKVIVQAMRQKNSSAAVVVTPQRIEEYYAAHRSDFTDRAQVKLRMIIVPKEGGDGPEAQRQMLEEVRRKIEAGAEFEKLAQLYSEDSSRAVGGDWGWISRGTLNEALSRVAFSLGAGEVSGVVESGPNYYLLKVDARKNEEVKSLKEVRGSIEQKLVQEARQQAQERWLEGLRKKAYIKVF